MPLSNKNNLIDAYKKVSKKANKTTANESVIQEGTDVFDKFGILITKTSLKGGIGYQINYGERNRYIQVLKKDMNKLIKAMQTAMKS